MGDSREKTPDPRHTRPPLLFTRSMACWMVRVLSLWDSLEAIKSFAGDDPEVAIYFPEDEKFLLAKEPRVLHYEVAVAEHDI